MDFDKFKFGRIREAITALLDGSPEAHAALEMATLVKENPEAIVEIIHGEDGAMAFKVHKY